MKTHLLVPLVGLAISFALPTFAQEKEEVKPFAFTPIPVLPQLVQQIEAINRKFDEARRLMSILTNAVAPLIPRFKARVQARLPIENSAQRYGWSTHPCQREL